MAAGAALGAAVVTILSQDKKRRAALDVLQQGLHAAQPVMKRVTRTAALNMAQWALRLLQ